jgi:hypothetical protein
MILDDVRFPLVFLRAHADGIHSDEQAGRDELFEGLLKRASPFVLIVEHIAHDHDDETSEERKAKALFFKRIKQRMASYCLGLIVIEGDSPLNAAARIAATGASKALGFPVQFVKDEGAAVAKGRSLLEQHRGRG